MFTFKRSFSTTCNAIDKWKLPDGINTGISIFNSITKNKVPLILKDKNLATWYSCGPTVYSSAHVGHASCYVKLDIIQRLLKNYFNINLVTAMSVTNIDDKIIKIANESATTPAAVAQKFEDEFWSDLSNLGVIKPDIALRVTDNIKVIQDFISELFQRKKCYGTSDGSVYFDVSKYDGYGKFRTEHNNADVQEQPLADFALWKGKKDNEPFWNASWGDGRPGWHIECSAMASKIFGRSVDFHAGGIDLQFPHHENEEAQSCAYHQCDQWVNYWLHVGHLQLRGDVKMSKSLQNTVLISDMLQTYSADEFRMGCLLSHYRSKMEYDDKFFNVAKAVLNKFRQFQESVSQLIENASDVPYDDDYYLLEELKQIKIEVDSLLKDDFKTSKSIEALLKLVTTVNKHLKNKNDKTNPLVLVTILSYVRNILAIMGLSLEKVSSYDSNKYVNIIDILVDFRNEVRLNSLSNKNRELLQACDIVRKKLNEKNIQVNDDSVKKISVWILQSSQ